MLACATSGKKLPPMMIFKHKYFLNETFPKGLEIKCNCKSWMNEEIMFQLLKTKRRKNKAIFSNPMLC